MSRIGVMGGTFDPIHTGHLLIGEAAYEQLHLDRVIYMPAGNPNFKQDRQGRATNDERYEMVRLAIANNPHFEISDIEMRRSDFSYTSVTLEELNKTLLNDKIYFIIGADSLFTIETWHRPDVIFSLCTIVVATRETTQCELDAKINELKAHFHADIVKLAIGNFDCSSTMLRQRIKGGESVRYYMPDAVISYIKEHGIYQ